MNTIEIYQQNIGFIADCKGYLKAVRSQNLEQSNLLSAKVISCLSTILPELIKQVEYYQNGGANLSQDYLISILKGLLEANENADDILMADLVELQLLPTIMDMQQAIRNQEKNLVQKDLYKKNMDALKEEHSEFVEVIESCNDCYEVEQTNTGLWTIALTDAQGRYYLHSNSDPYEEAEQFKNIYLQDGRYEYNIYGAGLFYHIVAFCKVNHNVKINVFESDVQILKTALTYVDLSGYILNGQINIILDQNFTKLKQILDDDQMLILHRPSLRNIKIKQVANEMRSYMIKESGVRNAKWLLASNFKSNEQICSTEYEQIAKTIKDKTVIIVAAGPSLKNNFEKVKAFSKKEDVVIISVSTVAWRLIFSEVSVDYIAHIDANEKTKNHFYSIWDRKIPLLMLSTGCMDIMKKYAGDGYLFCQKGFELAEEKAQKENLPLFETGGSVATFALDLAVQFKAKKIIMVGLDLAYTNHMAHMEGVSGQVVYETNFIKVQDVLGNEVDTSLVFYDMILWFEKYVKEHKSIPIIDATEGGAAIKGMPAMTLEEAMTF